MVGNTTHYNHFFQIMTIYQVTIVPSKIFGKNCDNRLRQPYVIRDQFSESECDIVIISFGVEAEPGFPATV